MTDRKDNIFVYALIGCGYLFFCSAVPSVIAFRITGMAGVEANNCYVPLAFLTGIIYVWMVFSFMKEKMELTGNITWKGAAEAFVTAAVLFLVINFVVSPFVSLLFPSSAQNYDASVTDMMTTPVITFFQVAFAAPLFEELIFRGLIMKRALRKWSYAFAVMMPALLFGILHMSFVQGISAAAAGIVLCLFYGRRRSVGLNILAHGLYNGMVFGLSLFIY
ncbi:MAG: CPBP family intramembrane metalloprotease [Lachnospiraceae bacterium]|nr:CPBP family intramembrane metalloprotease [Lachnospiraceae bacterium]